ncbi:MAG TPA: glycosyltransferase family 1 protein [Candidatus Sumerlaeota bacterium]|nr:glycosyltransferase family 1 protein [Candidatus Sumerlaeota bacterium]
MRIALSALQQRHYLTGTGRYLSEVFRHMARLEPSSEWLLYVKPDQVPLFPAEPPERLRVMDGCPSHPAGRILWEWLRFPGVLRKDGVDLYHGPANFLPVRKVCPYVLTLHDMFFFRNPGRTSRLRALYWTSVIRATWREADVILTGSEFARGEILRYLPVPPERIRVIPHGVDDKFFEPAPAAIRKEMRDALGITGLYILFAGRLDPDKNPEGLIRAFHLLVESGKAGDRSLVIAGARDYQSGRLPQLARILGLEERVLFTGYVEERHLPALYQEADVFCYPSRNEGFGLPPLEAMASGVPVVAGDSSSLPEVVGKAGILADPDDPRAIAQGIAEALEPGRGSEMREAGRARARTFTWERSAALHLDAYHEALNRRV